MLTFQILLFFLHWLLEDIIELCVDLVILACFSATSVGMGRLLFLELAALAGGSDNGSSLLSLQLSLKFELSGGCLESC